MAIEKMTIFSTYHLDFETNGLLESGSNFGIQDVFRYEYGYGFFTAAIGAAIDTSEFIPECIVAASAKTVEDGCVFFMFDRDGQIDSRLEEFDW